MNDELRKAAEKEVKESIDQYIDQLNAALAEHFGMEKLPAEDTE